MKRLSIVLLVILCTGCGFHRPPLYKDYQRIRVGYPVPPDIQKDAEWGKGHDRYREIGYACSESAKYQLANDGNVDAKWYTIVSMDLLLPILLLTGEDRSEGEILLNLNPTIEYTDSDIRKEIEKKCIEFWGGGNKLCEDTPLAELLKLAMDKGGLANEKFHLQKFEIDKIIPIMESRRWRMSRTSSGSYSFLVDHPGGKFLIVEWIFSWFDD